MMQSMWRGHEGRKAKSKKAAAQGGTGNAAGGASVVEDVAGEAGSKTEPGASS